jgi:hypothetical protein
MDKIDTSEPKRKRRDREVLGIEELSAEDIRAIALAKVPPEYASLDDFMVED